MEVPDPRRANVEAPMTLRNLVFDVGANNGDDTAYYLKRGFRVVAVEADPDMAAACRRRFASEIGRGEVILLNVVIAEEDGTAVFYISEGNRGVWSSLTEELARRTGLPARRVEVPARRFRGLLEEYGVPYYLKVDIEGADHLCLRDLTPANAPPYVSFEASEGKIEDLFWLAHCGYSRFKLIDQMDGFRQAMPPPFHSWQLVGASASGLLRRRLRDVPGLASLVRASRRLLRPRPTGNAAEEFPISSSGPMADESNGPWRSLRDVTHAWLYFVTKTTSGSWYDIHAARD
jgi:FkbM family methyltransferase